VTRGGTATGPERLLIAAAILPDGTAARALARVGVDAERLRAAVDSAHVAALREVGIEEPVPAGTGLGHRPKGSWPSPG
jgi:hypothetical protein